MQREKVVVRPRRNGYRGMPLAPRASEQPPENGLVSVYLSPRHVSSVIHWIKLPVGQGLTCNGNIPQGRLVARPEATEPTCGKCKILYAQREDRLEREAFNG